MDRFRWCSDDIEYRGHSAFSGVDEEAVILQQAGVRLYEGQNRTEYDNGMARLTTHRLLWVPSFRSTPFLALPLAAIISVHAEGGGGLMRNRTPKLTLRLLTQPALVNVLNSLPHPLPWTSKWQPSKDISGVVSQSSSENLIKLGFTQTGQSEFERALNEVLEAKVWSASLAPAKGSRSNRPLGTAGIGAVQREQAARAGATDQSIEHAFDDLNKLMSRAGEIVTLSRALVRQARDSKSFTSDETSELRATMLSMGVLDDEFTRLSKSNASSFHAQLARQLSSVILPLLNWRSESESGKESGAKHQSLRAGCIDLASAYCRLNRARGMELISPDDLLQACSLLESEQLPIRLKRFPSGLLVLHLASENERETLQATSDLVAERSCITAEELAHIASVSVLLARERLLAIEEMGLVCRDDSEAGLCFYPNLFTSSSSAA